MAEKQIKVTLVKSTIGSTPYQKSVVAALGLKKIRSFKIHEDNACIRGQIFRVKHMIDVQEIKD